MMVLIVKYVDVEEMCFMRYGNFKKHMIEEKYVIKEIKESTKIRINRNHKKILDQVNE